MKKLLLATIIILISSLTSVNAKEWFEFNSKELKIGNNNYKLKGTPLNPIITKNGNLLFGTGAGFIYEFNKNGLIHSHEENGIFYHVFDFNKKIIALSGTPLNAGGNSNIIIFSRDYRKRNLLFYDTFNGRTFVSYLKNEKDNLLLVNLGGFYHGNQYFIIDVNQEKIIWSEQDENSSMIPYKIIPNGFEFIKAETDLLNILDDKKENVIERYYKVNNIIIYQISFENRKDSTIHMLKTNLIDFFDISKKFSCIAAWCEDKILTDINDSNADYGYDNYLQNLLSNKTIKLKSFPKLRESHRDETEKVIFNKVGND